MPSIARNETKTSSTNKSDFKPPYGCQIAWTLSLKLISVLCCFPLINALSITNECTCVMMESPLRSRITSKLFHCSALNSWEDVLTGSLVHCYESASTLPLKSALIYILFVSKCSEQPLFRSIDFMLSKFLEHLIVQWHKSGKLLQTFDTYHLCCILSLLPSFKIHQLWFLILFSFHFCSSFIFF